MATDHLTWASEYINFKFYLISVVIKMATDSSGYMRFPCRINILFQFVAFTFLIKIIKFNFNSFLDEFFFFLVSVYVNSFLPQWHK